MKTKIFTVLAALLLSVGAFAQSGTSAPIKGDVNGDGVVDYGDINAVIQIMKNGGGVAVDNNAYFFYVGLEKPTSTSNPAANLVGPGKPGWHLIGDTYTGYNKWS